MMFDIIIFHIFDGIVVFCLSLFCYCVQMLRFQHTEHVKHRISTTCYTLFLLGLCIIRGPGLFSNGMYHHRKLCIIQTNTCIIFSHLNRYCLTTLPFLQFLNTWFYMLPMSLVWCKK